MNKKMTVLETLESGLSDQNREIISNAKNIVERQFCNYDHMGRFGNIGFQFFGIWEKDEIKDIADALKFVINSYLENKENNCLSAFLVDEIN